MTVGSHRRDHRRARPTGRARARARRRRASCSTMRDLDPASQAAAAERAGGVVAYTGPGLFVNRAIGMGVGAEADGDDVDFVIDFFDQRRMPAEIELCPFADDRLRTRASERGFAVAWFRTRIHARRSTRSMPAAEGHDDVRPRRRRRDVRAVGRDPSRDRRRRRGRGTRRRARGPPSRAAARTTSSCGATASTVGVVLGDRARRCRACSAGWACSPTSARTAPRSTASRSASASRVISVATSRS